MSDPPSSTPGFMGRVDEASRLLLEAGKIPGDPVLSSFGPDFVLAGELAERGQREAVIEYLRLCRNFWKMDEGRLERWTAELQAGGTPEFPKRSRSLR